VVVVVVEKQENKPKNAVQGTKRRVENTGR